MVHPTPTPLAYDWESDPLWRATFHDWLDCWYGKTN